MVSCLTLNLSLGDLIVQQNTVNNDQSCKIIMNFYSLPSHTSPRANQDLIQIED